MKYLKCLLVGGFVLLLTSSYTTRTSGLSEGIYPGNLIPDINIRNESGDELKLSDFKGQKVLVSFWAAYDANSHMKNVLLWNTLNKKGYPIRMVSISFDQSKSVFERTLRLDGIDTESHFIDLAGENSALYKAYRFEKKGFKSFLVDEKGMIIKTDVMPEDIAQL